MVAVLVAFHRVEPIQKISFAYTKNTKMVFDYELRNWINVTLKCQWAQQIFSCIVKMASLGTDTFTPNVL